MSKAEDLSLERTSKTTSPSCSQIIRGAALCASLVVSAYLMSLATRGSGQSWLGWFSLLPLFQAIRVLQPSRAFLCGGLWGFSAYAFGISGASGVTQTYTAALLMTLIPAAYTAIGAQLTRSIGFSPYLLALGWMGVEVALRPLGLHHGLLAATQGDEGFLIRVIGSFAGFVLIAFLVAYFNATLLSALSEVRFGTAGARRVFGSFSPQRRIFASEIPLHPTYLVRPSQPRAPPA